MKITFISGPYQPLKCGISDYIDLLSDKLKKNHHACDHFSISKKDSLINISRDIPSADLYSIQFAPYAFSDYGLPRKGLLRLAKSLGKKKTHINFHEIWIGAYPQASLKEKTMGWIQKREIIKFIRLLKPSLITCSNSAAMDRMQSTLIKINYLYLFGNIPYSQIHSVKESSQLTVVFFGTPYNSFPYEILADKLKNISKILKKSIHIKIIGRSREAIGLNKIIKISKFNDFRLSQLGEIPECQVSQELQNSDIGVSTTPYDIIGKSGATAAMLEHRLPVLAYDDGDTPREKLYLFEEFKDQLFLLNDHSMITRLNAFMQKSRKPFYDGVAYTAKKMIELIH